MQLTSTVVMPGAALVPNPSENVDTSDILEEASLVVGVKRGRERHYHLNPEPLTELTEWLHPFERYWRDRLSDLAHLMENNPQ